MGSAVTAGKASTAVCIWALSILLLSQVSRQTSPASSSDKRQSQYARVVGGCSGDSCRIPASFEISDILAGDMDKLEKAAEKSTETVLKKKIPIGSSNTLGTPHHVVEGVGSPSNVPTDSSNILPDFLLSDEDRKFTGCDKYAENQLMYLEPLIKEGYLRRERSTFVKQGLYTGIYKATMSAGQYSFSDYASSILDRNTPDRRAIIVRFRICNPDADVENFLDQQCYMQNQYAETLPFGVVNGYRFVNNDLKKKMKSKYNSNLKCFEMPKGVVDGKAQWCEDDEKNRKKRCPVYCYCMQEAMRGDLYDGLPTAARPESQPVNDEDKDWLYKTLDGKVSLELTKAFQYLSPNMDMMPAVYYFYKNAREYGDSMGSQLHTENDAAAITKAELRQKLKNAFKLAYKGNEFESQLIGHTNAGTLQGTLTDGGSWTVEHAGLQDKDRPGFMRKRKEFSDLWMEEKAGTKAGQEKTESKMGNKGPLDKERFEKAQQMLIQIQEEMMHADSWESNTSEIVHLPASWKNARDTFWRILLCVSLVNNVCMHSMMKPGNILLAEERFYDERSDHSFDSPRPSAINIPKLNDFGHSMKVLKDNEDHACVQCEGYAFYESSTPDYTPPELLVTLFAGQRDIFIRPHQLDVFAVAIMLFEYTTATNIGTYLKEGFSALEGDQDGNVEFFSPEWNMQKLGQMVLATDPQVWIPLFHSLRDSKFMSHLSQFELDGFEGDQLAANSYDKARPNRYEWHSEFERVHRDQAIEFIRDCISTPLEFEPCDGSKDVEKYCDITAQTKLPKDKRVCCRSKKDSGCKPAEYYLENFAFFVPQQPSWH